jgi:hypothetical protein
MMQEISITIDRSFIESQYGGDIFAKLQVSFLKNFNISKRLPLKNVKISPLTIPHSIEWTRTSTFHPSLKESQSEAEEYPSDSQSITPTTEKVNQVQI